MKLAAKKAEAEQLDSADIAGRDSIYQEIDAMGKDRDKKIEEILLEILPEAFAVVKETARRFKENTELVSTATELDKTFSITKKYITIDGDKAIYKNTWTAGGSEITWNMVHYDVQLSVVLFCTRVKLQKWQPVKVKRWYLHCLLI